MTPFSAELKYLGHSQQVLVHYYYYFIYVADALCCGPLAVGWLVGGAHNIHLIPRTRIL